MKTKNCKGWSDEQLVSLLQQGDKNAMSELYQRYHMVVFHKCLSFSKNTNDASDMTQDIMVKLMSNVNSFNGLSKFSTWLYSITFNYCIDHQRKNKGRFIESIDNLVDLYDTSSDEKTAIKEYEQKKKCANKVLSKISMDDQQLLMMKYYNNKSIQDLQELYEVSASAIKMRLKRARNKAMQLLKLELAA